MADAFTPLLGLYYPTASGDVLTQANLQNSALAIDNYFAKFLAYALPKGGFLLSTDYNISAGTGQEFLISAGAVFNLTANGPKLNFSAVQQSLTPSNSGMVGSSGGTLNYVFVNADGSLTVNQTGTPPAASSQLAATGNVTNTAVNTLNSFPSGRVNLDKRLYEVTVTWDPPSLANAAATTTTVTVLGVVAGDMLIAVPTVAPTAGMFYPPCQVTAADTVRITLVNLSGGTVDLANTTFNIYVFKF